MRTLSTPCGKLLVIQGLPEDAENIRVIQITGPAVLYYEFGNSKWKTTPTPPGSWSLLGKASELTEEQCRIVIPVQYFVHAETTPSFKDYTDEWSGFVNNARKSFASFLTFHGIKPEDVLLIENKK